MMSTQGFNYFRPEPIVPSDILPLIIKANRYNEVVPTRFSRAEVISMAETAGRARQLGMPEVGVTQLANKMLVEGRGDAGTNEYNTNNKRAVNLYNTLRSEGYPHKSSAYAAAVLDKSEVASRLNIPFEMAWNGTGRASETKRTGRQHAERAEQHKNNENKNEDLIDTISRAVSGELTSKEQLVKADDISVRKMLFGDPDPKSRLNPHASAARKAITSAYDSLYSLPHGRRAAVSITDTPSAESIVSAAPDLYNYYSGIDIGETVKSESFKELANHPVTKIIFGVDPKGQEFLSKFNEKNPPPKSIVEYLTSIFD